MRLGFWQLDRADEKSAKQEQYLTAGVEAELNNSNLLALQAEYQAVSLQGSYQPELQLLLDSQVQDGVVGYQVFSIAKLRNIEPLLLVNRGWVATADAAALMLPEQELQLIGQLASLPKPGMRLGEPVVASPADGLRVVNYPTQAEFEAILGQAILPWQLWLAPEAEHGFIRDWQPINLPPEKHHGYAVQWFALALAVLFITLILSWRYFTNRKHHD